jgi:capsular polysaccharide export protein
VAARATGLRTWILENGYQRPDWITLETEGVNARSGLPREAAAYDHADRLPPPHDGPHLGAITPFHVYNTVQHFTVMVACSPFMTGYRYPYSISIAGQVLGHTRRFVQMLLGRSARARHAESESARRPYFLLCLQREGDSQLVVHSEVKTNTRVLEQTIASFDRHAPAEARLLVKNHPLDPGLIDLEGITRRIAAEHGVAARVAFLEGGVFAALARGSSGVIAVNSTAALAAAGFGAPVKLLGRAFFDIDGLIDQQPLDGFWRAPRAPDHDLFTRFRRRMSVETQVYGSYHNPRALRPTAERVAGRMLAGVRTPGTAQEP